RNLLLYSRADALQRIWARRTHMTCTEGATVQASRTITTISALFAAVIALSGTSSAAVPTPKEVLGHSPGEDYYLATYEDEVAYDMDAAEGDAQIDAIRDNVILVLWPTLNPDGMDMIVDWYRKNRGGKFETSQMPWLYQEYVGHDNNRDGYMLNMIESQNVF